MFKFGKHLDHFKNVRGKLRAERCASLCNFSTTTPSIMWRFDTIHERNFLKNWKKRMQVLPPVKIPPPILPRTVFVFETMHPNHAGLVAAAAKISMHCETNLKCEAVAVVAMSLRLSLKDVCTRDFVPPDTTAFRALRNLDIASDSSSQLRVAIVVRTTFVWRALTL